MKKGEIVKLNIEKLIYGGEGIGKTPEGMTVFVPDTVSGDLINAEILTVKKNFAKAIIKEVIIPSEQRVKPFCPLAKVCGGCQWQHVAYEEQLRAKKQIIEECIHSIAGMDIPVKEVIRNDEITEYRCKVQYPVGQKKVSKNFTAGYYKKGTHEIVNIKYCPIQPRIIDEITEFLRTKAFELNLTAYEEKTGRGLIRHFVFRYSQTNKNLILTIVVNASNQENDSLKDLCILVKKEFSDIEGVLVNFNTSRTNIIMGRKTELIEGNNHIEEVLDGKIFRISADSFFQVNPHAAQKMFSEVRNIVSNVIPHQVQHENKEKPSILDVYAGSGSFSIYLSDLASGIKAVEESESAVQDGLENLKLNNINNISFIQGNAYKILQDMANNREKFDVVVLDPPRKGCSESVINAVKQIAENYVIYISCNPSTLARDIKLLGEGFAAEFIQPVDMFCHTYHVESIAVLKKR